MNSCTITIRDYAVIRRWHEVNGAISRLEKELGSVVGYDDKVDLSSLDPNEVLHGDGMAVALAAESGKSIIPGWFLPTMKSNVYKVFRALCDFFEMNEALQAQTYTELCSKGRRIIEAAYNNK